MSPLPRDIRSAADLMAWLEIDHIRFQDHDALGWVLVTLDDETGKVVHVTGFYATPEDALIEGGRRSADDEKIKEPGDAGWSHIPAPLYPPSHAESSPLRERRPPGDRRRPH